MTRPTKVTINLAALRSNLQRVKQLAPSSLILAMVKSNAYGHGLDRIAHALHDADALGVACSEEGVLLRAAGIKHPIVLMEGLFFPDELALAAANQFTLVLHHAAQVAMFEQSTLSDVVSVWLKIDTGMHRLGFEPSEARDIYTRLMQCQAVKKPIGLMTHFAEADSVDRTATQQQIEIFNTATQDLEGPRSLSNSAGIIAWPAAHAAWVRPGIMLYGVSPFVGHSGTEYQLQPVMALSSELIAIHHITKGARVGYGGMWTAPEDMCIGIVAAGYGDGYPRHAQNGTPMLVNERPCPLIGRVSMDMITVDLRTQPHAKVGDPVLLWGTGLPVETIAKFSDTTGYELLTRITQRVHVEVKE